MLLVGGGVVILYLLYNLSAFHAAAHALGAGQ
jgi:hypothetical protein